MKIGKYAFVDKAQADSKIEALGVATDEDGNIYPTHKHSIVHLGNIVLELKIVTGKQRHIFRFSYLFML